LIDGLRKGSGFTLGLYSEGAGHTVTPFAVSKSGSVFDIAVYDSNFPQEVTHVLVDEETQTWRYDVAAINCRI